MKTAEREGVSRLLTGAARLQQVFSKFQRQSADIILSFLRPENTAPSLRRSQTKEETQSVRQDETTKTTPKLNNALNIRPNWLPLQCIRAHSSTLDLNSKRYTCDFRLRATAGGLASISTTGSAHYLGIHLPCPWLCTSGYCQQQ